MPADIRDSLSFCHPFVVWTQKEEDSRKWAQRHNDRNPTVWCGELLKGQLLGDAGGQCWPRVLQGYGEKTRPFHVLPACLPCPEAAGHCTGSAGISQHLTLRVRKRHSCDSDSGGSVGGQHWFGYPHAAMVGKLLPMPNGLRLGSCMADD